MGDQFGIGKAVEKLMDPVTELVKRIAGPAADEIGLTLADSVKVYRAKRQLKLFEKMSGFVSDAGFVPNPVALKLLLPALDYASVEDDEDLHTAWAALLANASDPSEGAIEVLPSFAGVLRELSPRDAQFLKTLYSNAEKRVERYAHKQETWDMGYSYGDIMAIYAEGGLARFPKNHREATRKEYEENKDVIEADRKDVSLILETMKRQALIGEHESSELEEITFRGKPKIHTQISYHLSMFGAKFIRACQPPRSQKANSRLI
jgi:hypothetical protein